MDDAPLVRRFHRAGDLTRDLEGFIDGDRSGGNALGERLALDELEDQRLVAVLLLEPVDRCNVRMIERGEDLRLPAEPGQPLVVAHQAFREDLDRDFSRETRVPCPIHLPHAAGAERFEDLVRTEFRAGRKRHARKGYNGAAVESDAWTCARFRSR